jgi:oligoribonuclease
MTGLDVDNDVVIEIFCIITNGDLEVLDENGWGTVVHQTKERMDQMVSSVEISEESKTKVAKDEWCTRTHGENGLTQAVIASSVTPEQAAAELFEYIRKYVPEPKVALLAGSSVHADKAFLRKEPYKKAIDHLSHRILDVSSLKEAARRWSPQEVLQGTPKKMHLHKAKDDILESIAEAKYYKEVIFQRRTT